MLARHFILTSYCFVVEPINSDAPVDGFLLFHAMNVLVLCSLSISRSVFYLCMRIQRLDFMLLMKSNMGYVLGLRSAPRADPLEKLPVRKLQDTFGRSRWVRSMVVSGKQYKQFSGGNFSKIFKLAICNLGRFSETTWVFSGRYPGWGRRMVYSL